LAFLLVVPKTAQAVDQALIQQLTQQIKALKQEIALMRATLANWHSKNAITASAYLAQNLSDNSVLLSKNPNKSYPIASIVKLMNAVVTHENIDNGKMITVTDKMLKPFGQSPAIFFGANISAQNLLKASLIQSTNDAAEALACSAGEEKFLGLMNQKAKELGMTSTVFYDAHGLDPANHSTASDLTKLLSYIYKNHPDILETTKDNDFWLPNINGKLVKFINMNGFYPISNFIGGKTGYLVEAKQTLAALFDVNGEPVAVIVLHSKNCQADAFRILEKIENSKNPLN